MKSRELQASEYSSDPGTQRETPANSRFWSIKPVSFLVHGCWAMMLACAPKVTAQYAITWSTINGGGGTSSGGAYRVRGTIGQADAGQTMSKVPYAVTGGFWALAQAVQVPGAPTLTIAPAGPGQVMLSWPTATPGWVLQESLTLVGGWKNSASGATNPVTVAIVPPRKFYRLAKP